MKKRDFHLRLDQTPGANLRRLHAYIRNIKPDYQPVPKMVHRGNVRAMLRLVKSPGEMIGSKQDQTP